MYMIIRRTDMLEAVPLDYTQPIFCDTETCIDEGKTDGGLYGRIRLFQFYQDGWDEAIMVDCFSVPLHNVLRRLKPGHLVFHNASYDLHTINLYTEEVWLPKRLDDTIYMARLSLWQKTNRFEFYKCLEACNMVDDTIDGFDKTENQRADWAGNLTPTMLRYAACDVLYLYRLYPFVNEALNTQSYRLDIANLRYAIEYSRRPIHVDQERVTELLQHHIPDQEDLLKELPVNPNSPKQCKELLKTDSSDMETLVELRLRGNEIAGKIRKARQQHKTISYLHKYNRPRIYGFYNPCGAITGRFSCTGGNRFDHDNLQQIPRRLLDCLVARDGYVFVYKDYSGLELRMAVAWIDDPVMKHLIMNKIDIHTYTATVIYKKVAEDITPFERMIGKICNFLLIYGGSPRILKATIMSWGEVIMPDSEVKTIYDAWFDEYEYFREWHKLTKRTLNVYGYADVNTALGRNVRAYTINDALNIPVQGSSSECTKVSLMMLKNRYPDEYLISTIHDSNTLEVPEDEAHVWGPRLDECMLEAWEYVIRDLPGHDIPMDPGVKINNRWEWDDTVVDTERKVS